MHPLLLCRYTGYIITRFRFCTYFALIANQKNKKPLLLPLKNIILRYVQKWSCFRVFFFNVCAFKRKGIFFTGLALFSGKSEQEEIVISFIPRLHCMPPSFLFLSIMSTLTGPHSDNNCKKIFLYKRVWLGEFLVVRCYYIFQQS